METFSIEKLQTPNTYVKPYMWSKQVLFLIILVKEMSTINYLYC